MKKTLIARTVAALGVVSVLGLGGVAAEYGSTTIAHARPVAAVQAVPAQPGTVLPDFASTPGRSGPGRAGAARYGAA